MHFLEEVEMSAEDFADLVRQTTDDQNVVAKMREHLDNKQGK